MGPVLLQNSVAVVVNLNLPANLKPDALSSQVEAADTGKERTNGERCHGVVRGLEN
jgi:hypothetical protein